MWTSEQCLCRTCLSQECGHNFDFKVPKLSLTSETRGACDDAGTDREADAPVVFRLHFARRCACRTSTLPVKGLRFGHQWKTRPRKHFAGNGVSALQPAATPFLAWGLTCGSETRWQDGFSFFFQWVAADATALRLASKRQEKGELVGCN